MTDDRWTELHKEIERLRGQPQTPEVSQRLEEIDAELDAIEEGVIYLAKRKAK